MFRWAEGTYPGATGRLTPQRDTRLRLDLAPACYAALMQHAKETVRSLLDQLPDNCSLDDVLYHLYVIQAVEQGRADAKAGRLIPHDEVARELRSKWRADREQ